MKVAPVDIHEVEVRPAEAAARHVASARHLLTELHNRLRIDRDYHELHEAVTELKVALSILRLTRVGSFNSFRQFARFTVGSTSES